jgi:hypothetical protein
MRNTRKQSGGQPLSYVDAKYQEVAAPAGFDRAEVQSPYILRSGLPMTPLRGGFYPSVYGGVVQNAPFLIPAAARQGFSLFSKYRKSRSRRRPSKKTRKARNTRKARKARK